MAFGIYKLIDFKEETQRKIRSIDFVPADWITYDLELKDLVTQFMPPPYSKENLALLHGLVKVEAPPPESWPKYRVDIIGEARTYDNAVEKLKILEEERFAFSTDCEEHAAEKAQAVKKIYQSKHNPNHAKEIAKLSEVPELCEEVDLSETQSEPIGADSNGIVKSSKASDASKQSAKCTSEGNVQSARKQVARHTNPPEQKSEEEDLLTAYRSHSLQMTRIQTTLDEIKRMLQDLGKGSKPTTGHLISEKTFAETHDIILPFQTMTEFQELETKLAADQNVCTQLKRDMWYLIEPKSDLTRSISNIIKKYLTRAVVINFTAVKKCAGKEILSSTVFCKCMKELIVNEYGKNPKNSPIRDKKFHDALGTVLNNAKDWEGQRLFRKKKTVAEC